MNINGFHRYHAKYNTFIPLLLVTRSWYKFFVENYLPYFRQKSHDLDQWNLLNYQPDELLFVDSMNVGRISQHGKDDFGSLQNLM